MKRSQRCIDDLEKANGVYKEEDIIERVWCCGGWTFYEAAVFSDGKRSGWIKRSYEQTEAELVEAMLVSATTGRDDVETFCSMF
jgi:hypothetical protein